MGWLCSKCSYNSDISRGSFFPFFFRISGTHQRNALKEETYFITYTQIEIPFNSHQKLSWPKRNRNKTDTMVFENHKKVSFNIASKASYFYSLSRQKFIKNAKNVPFGEFMKTCSLLSNSVARQVNFDGTKVIKNTQCLKITKNVAFEFFNFQGFKSSQNRTFLAFLMNFCPLKM